MSSKKYNEMNTENFFLTQLCITVTSPYIYIIESGINTQCYHTRKSDRRVLKDETVRKNYKRYVVQIIQDWIMETIT